MTDLLDVSQDPLPTTWHALARDMGPLSFAWPNWLPNGLLTLLAAQPGQGKSALALRVCQSFINGMPWPDGSRYRGRRGKVLWCECESAQAINVHRARQWGLRTDRILCPLPDGSQDVRLDLAEHRALMAHWLAQDDVRMAVVDSLRGAHRGDENSSRGIEVLAFLAGLARDTGKPILLVHHLRKGSGRETAVTLDRVRGSSAIVQNCRLVWALDTPDPLTPRLNRLHVIKNNLGPNPPPVAFEITSHGLDFAVDSIPARAEERPLERACTLLRALLSPAPVPTVDIQTACDQAGLSWSTVKRAKQRLRVVAVKDGAGGCWYWRLPSSRKHEEDQEVHSQALDGHSWSPFDAGFASSNESSSSRC